MTTTALDIIRKSMQKLGVLTKTEVPSADEAADALSALNAMLSSWSNESIMCYARTWENFTLTANQALYTIGTGQNFNTVRPISIAAAYIRNGTTDTPVSVISDEIYFNQISQKAAQGLPQYLNIDNAYPYGNIRLFNVPSSAYVLYLLTEKPLSSFTLNQTVDLPPGWERALIFNLPGELAGDYDQPVPETVATNAIKSKSAISQAIMRVRNLDATPKQIATNNVFTGWNR